MSDSNGDSKHATSVTDIALPVEYVELEHLRTRGGDPVVVRCEGLNELILAEVFQSLPGARPPEVRLDGIPPEEPDPVEQMRAVNVYAPRLIEAGTSLIGPGGEEVRPAFYFGEEHHPLSIPGRMLREGDKVLLITAIMRLGGYGGAAEAEVFPVERGGTGDGVGVVEAGESVGADAVGGAAGP